MHDVEAAAIEDDICDDEDADTTDIKGCMSDKREQQLKNIEKTCDKVDGKMTKDGCDTDGSGDTPKADKFNEELDEIEKETGYPSIKEELPVIEDYGNTVTDDDEAVKEVVKNLEGSEPWTNYPIEQKPIEEEEVSEEEEMSGILNIVIDSLKTIHENKKIYVNSTISQRRAKAELIADPVKAFLDIKGWTASTNQAEEYVTKDVFYKDFTKFCNDHKLHVLSYDAFAKKLKKEHELLNGRKIEDDSNGNKTKITVWFVKHITDEEKTAKKEDEEEV